jgi:hypothetical protein
MGYIKNGKYVKGTAPKQSNTENITWKSQQHDEQRMKHRRDMIQPYEQNGEMKQEFIDQYLLKDKFLAEQYGFNPGEQQ